MGFQSLSFLLLLALTAVLCPLAAKKSRPAGIALFTFFSVIFYLWGLGIHAMLGLAVLALGSLVTFAAARTSLSGPEKPKKRVLLTAAAWHIAVLLGFKYLGFFTGGAVSLGWAPLGLSFFTFQQLWFLKEVGTRQFSLSEPARLRGDEFALFSLFFPTVSSGPILRPDGFFPQLRSENFLRPDWDDRAAGLYAFSLGMAKKVLLADSLGAVVNGGYAHLDGLTAHGAWLVILGYTLQLYFDFSGYCDIATGATRLLGLRLPINFDSPYRSLSVGEFWKRWHITLTTFLRECLYFPLGGSRRGEMRTYGNILLVFLVSGFWHGAGWTFLFWGLLHGLAQVAERAAGVRLTRLPKTLRWAGTFLFVNLAWVFFRAPSLAAAASLLRSAFSGGAGIPAFLTENLLPSETTALSALGLGPSAGNLLLAAVFFIALLAALKPGNTVRRMDTFRPTGLRCAVCCILLAWAALSFSGVTTFIYANF
ncbi:MBOAT family protein [Oscillibacter sp. GMB15532]|uniref:MBOAT family O-acyltransferase n=1 Tax=Oscillibacter sp. GMB15532 TaxID=3230022 RepID=UPI0034DEDF53